jgi:O-antigen/teichoic acid export membrane protein
VGEPENQRGGAERRTVPREEIRRGAGGFLRNTSLLMAGTTLAQALPLLATPILTRYFTPEAFGLAALFGSISTVIGVVACLRYELAIMLPGDDRRAADVLLLCLLLVVATTLVVGVIAWAWGAKLLSLLGAPQLAPYAMLLPVSAFLGGLFLVLRNWTGRYRNFAQIAQANVAGAGGRVAVALACGVIGLRGGIHLIVARLLVPLAGALLLARHFVRHDLAFVLRGASLGGVRRAAERYRRFPRFSFGGALMNSTSQNVPQLLLPGLLGPAVAGQYYQAFAVLQLPMILVGNAVGQVFFQRASELRASGGDLAPLVDRVYQSLARLIVLPMGIVLAAGPDLFAFVLGDPWRPAGILARMLIPWLIVAFTLSPMMMNLISVLERQPVGLAFEAVMLALRSGVILGASALALSAPKIILAYSVVGAACLLWMASYLFRAVGLSPWRIARHLGLGVLCAALPVLGLYAIRRYLAPAPPLLLLICAAAAALYLILIMRLYGGWEAILRGARGAKRRQSS